MAGTGHPYEIANLSAVVSAIEDAAARVPEGEARRWFNSRHMLRFLTSPPYVTRVPQECGGVIEAFDEDERSLLAAKAAAGGDVRLFSRVLHQAIGPDLDHVADWISWVATNDLRTYAKLSRIAVPQAAVRAEEWTLSLMARETASKGRTRAVMRTAAGRTWFELLDADALSAEGAAMSHCVGSYASDVLSGRSRILSLRDGRGKSLVTAEFKTGPLRLCQARSVGNASVPSNAHACLASLMNRLGAAPTSQAEVAGVALDDSGRWAPIADVWERTEWNGFAAVAAGKRMIVMSPLDPTRSLAQVTFMDQGRTAGIALPADKRHFHIDELRAAARIRNALESNGATHVLTPWPGVWKVGDNDVERTWVAQRDVWERRVIGGVTCLVEQDSPGKNIHVTKADDEARTLLVIRSHAIDGVPPASLTATPMNSGRWSLTEARRCIAVMTAMGVRRLETHTDDGKSVRERWRPMVSPDGTWSLFAQDAETAPAITCQGKWRFNDWHAELSAPSGTVSFDRKGACVTHVWNWFIKKEVAEEAAAFMQAQGWRAEGRVRFARRGKPDSPWLAYFRGRWLAVSSSGDFLGKAFGLLPQRRAYRLSLAEAEAVFDSLPEERMSAEADRLLAASLEAWLRVAPKEKARAVFFDVASISSPEQHWSDSWEGRLRMAARLNGALRPAAQKAVGKIASILLKQTVSGRSRKFGINDRLWDAAERILTEHAERVPDVLAARVLKKAFRGFSHIPVRRETSAPHRAWLGPLMRVAETHALLGGLREAADRTLSMMNFEAVGSLALEDACTWLGLLNFAAAGRFHFGATRRIGEFADLLERIASEAVEGREAWQALAREAAKFRGLLKKDFYGPVTIAA